MSLLNDLFAEAHDEVLQELWDRNLIKMWRAPSHMYTNRVVVFFKSENNITYEKLYTLKRTPRYGKQQWTTVARFIAAYLPKLSDKLWDNKMTEDELVAWLGKSKIDTLMDVSDLHKTRAETKEKRHVKLKYQQTTTDKNLDDRWYDGHLRSAWTTVKGKSK